MAKINLYRYPTDILLTFRLSEKLHIVDVKIQVVEVPSQICTTMDDARVHISSVIYYRIKDAYKATFEIGPLRPALIKRTETAFQRVLRASTRAGLRVWGDDVGEITRNEISEDAETWGVDVQNILVKEFNVIKETSETNSKSCNGRRKEDGSNDGEGKPEPSTTLNIKDPNLKQAISVSIAGNKRESS